MAARCRSHLPQGGRGERRSFAHPHQPHHRSGNLCGAQLSAQGRGVRRGRTDRVRGRSTAARHRAAAAARCRRRATIRRAPAYPASYQQQPSSGYPARGYPQPDRPMAINPSGSSRQVKRKRRSMSKSLLRRRRAITSSGRRPVGMCRCHTSRSPTDSRRTLRSPIRSNPVRGHNIRNRSAPSRCRSGASAHR